MTSVLLDLILLAVLAFCVYQGYRKGLILSAAGVLIVILSIWGGGIIAARFQEPITEMLTPVLSWVTDDATDEAARGIGRISDVTRPGDVEAVAGEAYKILGISEKEIGKFTDGVLELMAQSGSTLRTSVAHVFLSKIVHVILYIFGYALVCILLTLLANFVSAVFKLPGLKLLDKTGGSALGLIYGFVFLFAVAFVLRFTGILIDQETISKSVLGNLFVNGNPFSGLIMK